VLVFSSKLTNCNESPMERKFHMRNFHSQEQKYVGMKVPRFFKQTECQHSRS